MEHYKGSEIIIIEKFYEYDQIGRLLATRVKVNSQPEFTQTGQQYNEIGEQITKYLHADQTTSSRTFRQKSDFTYNIKGWLTQINNPDLSSDNDLFGMQLFYNTTTGMDGLAPSEGLYNGNIVGMKWQIKGDTMRGYKFIYDSLNRVLQSKYADGASLGGHTDYYSELIKGYDKAGNIQGLKRNFNNTLVDSLNYKYINNLNKLAKITDSGTANGSFDDYPGTSQSYGYDSNGNMSRDGSKNFTVSHIRSLNLPQMLDYGSNKRIFYHYTAGGAKLAKHSIPGSGSGTLIQYVGNVVYIDGTLSYILTEEGRLIADGTGANRKFLNEYNLKDHLGNARLTFMGSNLGNTIDIVQTTNYYPFGLVMNQVNSNTWSDYKINKYLYNGKERQDDKMTSESLNWYDYGARFYDPQIGRWHVVDPLAEKYYEWTPYNYVGNNPIHRLDLFGLDWYTDKDGSYQYDPKVNKDTKLKDGQAYVGKTYVAKDKNGKVITNYRKDGSILYANRVDAIKRLDSNTKKTGNEELAVMTKGGGALVTPDYKNSSGECNPFERYGYDTKGGNIVDAEGNTFETEGTIHTHYGIGSDKNNLPDPFPSGITWGVGDLETLSSRTPNKPIMTMGWDGKVYGVFGYYNSNGDLKWNWLKNSGSVKVEEIMKTDIKLQLLMNGVFKLK